MLTPARDSDPNKRFRAAAYPKFAGKQSRNQRRDAFRKERRRYPAERAIARRIRLLRDCRHAGGQRAEALFNQTPGSAKSQAHDVLVRTLRPREADGGITRQPGPCYDGSSHSGGSLMAILGMNRRALIAALGGAAAWPRVALAQQQPKVWRIGMLETISADLSGKSRCLPAVNATPRIRRGAKSHH